MGQNIALGKNSHDIFFVDGQLAMVVDNDNIEQKLKSRLQTFLGEWYLETSIGLPFFTEILIKNPDIPNIDSLIKAEIIDTEGVLELVEYGSEFKPAERSFSVEFKVLTTVGEVEFSDTIFNSETP